MTTSSTREADASTSTAAKGKPPPSDDDNYEDAFDAGLFLNEEYVTVSVPVEFADEEETAEGGEKRQPRPRRSLALEVSEAASTDFDLTGQVLWPAATLLSDYLVNDNTLASSCDAACELGAGLGLSGLAAVAFSGLKKLVLTDGSDVVLRVLSRNAARVSQSAPGSPEVSAELLEWGDGGATDALLERCFPRPAAGRSSGGRRGFDLLLGADVTYSLAALPALFETAAALLLRRERGQEESDVGGKAENDEKVKITPTFLLGYVSRSAALDRAVPLEARNAGFVVEVVEGTRRRLPGGQEGWILSLTLREVKK